MNWVDDKQVGLHRDAKIEHTFGKESTYFTKFVADVPPEPKKQKRRLEEAFIVSGRVTHCKLSCKCGKIAEELVTGTASPTAAMRRLHAIMRSHVCGRNANG